MTNGRQLPRARAIIAALYRLYEHSQFSMAGAVAFSFILSLFPFCIFIGALSGVLGGPGMAQGAVGLIFQVFPKQVAAGLAPQVEAVLGSRQVGLLTLGAGAALFFATSAIETLRAALNGAYRVRETRTYPLCLLFSIVFVFVNALGMLALTWLLVVGPALAARYEPAFVEPLLSWSWTAAAARYAISSAIIAAQLAAVHIWLAAGRRTFAEVWPGVFLSVALLLSAAGLYSYYLNFNDYTRFYAGLSQLMVALIYFQVTAIIIILGAEVNRGLIELRKPGALGARPDPAPSLSPESASAA